MKHSAPLLSILTCSLLLSMATISGCATAEGQQTTITVYKTPTCGCCVKWVDHMKAHGYEVKTVNADNLTPIKNGVGVPRNLGSCHTAMAGKYVFEGHIPADVITRFLEEKPDAKGLAVPGMPIGSPGMEVEGHPADSYQVMAFDKTGRTWVYAEM